jgi:hypothetical protein
MLLRDDGLTILIAPNHQPVEPGSPTYLAAPVHKLVPGNGLVGNLSKDPNATYISWYGASLGGQYVPLAAAQMFTAPSSKTIHRIDVWLALAGGSGNAEVAIYSDAGGVPGTMLGGHDVAPAGQVGSCWALTHAKVKVPVAAGQPYWVAVTPDSGANVVWWFQDFDFVEIAAYPDTIVQEHGAKLLLLAIVARSEATLSHGATAVLRARARDIISAGGLDAICGSAMAAHAVDLLNYPVGQDLSDDVPRWLSVLDRPGISADGQSRVNFEAYMYVIAIKSRKLAAWNLLRHTLSGLRSIVLAGGLVNPAYELLNAPLPPDGWNSWDFHKRILIGLRELRRCTSVGQAVVAQLGLPDDDLEFVLEDRKKKRDRVGSIFCPWS